LLCSLGGALATALVYASSPFLPGLLGEIAQVPSGGAPSRHAILAVQTAPDLTVLMFAALAVVLTAVAFGLTPALRSARIGLATAMKPGTRPAIVRRVALPAASMMIGGQV